MRAIVQITPEARQDIAEAFHWYERQERGLGREFVLCVETGLGKIRGAPRAYPQVYGNVRRLVLSRFPYGILYVDGPGEIAVLAVFHARRDPEEWKSRI
ncbi:MAG: type II toxin-antitoxin system RelE/ParE family toxin [Thermodesulfobacteriota bacterium]